MTASSSANMDLKHGEEWRMATLLGQDLIDRLRNVVQACPREHRFISASLPVQSLVRGIRANYDSVSGLKRLCLSHKVLDSGPLIRGCAEEVGCTAGCCPSPLEGATEHCEWRGPHGGQRAQTRRFSTYPSHSPRCTFRAPKESRRDPRWFRTSRHAHRCRLCIGAAIKSTRLLLQLATCRRPANGHAASRPAGRM